MDYIVPQMANATLALGKGAMEPATMVRQTALYGGKVAELYAGIDLSQVNHVEWLWALWYSMFDNLVLATGVLAFLMHETVYFGRCVPWMIIDRTPFFNRYKIQDEKIPSVEDQWKCTKSVLLTHFTVESVQIVGFHPMAASVGMQTWQVPFPSWQKIALQVIVFALIEDTWHYFFHRALHHKKIYKYIHKQHHEFSAPFGLAAEYAHPIEILLLGLGTVGAPLLWCAITQDLHLWTVFCWITFRLFQAVDAHSGYDMPWSLHNFLPVWGGADHHDFHHAQFTNNYSSSFRHWDYFLGTDKKYMAWKAKKHAERKIKAGPVEADMLRELEKKTE